MTRTAIRHTLSALVAATLVSAFAASSASADKAIPQELLDTAESFAAKKPSSLAAGSKSIAKGLATKKRKDLATKKRKAPNTQPLTDIESGFINR